MGIGVLKKFSEIGATPYLLYNYHFFNLKEKIDANIDFQQVRLSDYFHIISGFAFSSKDYQVEGVKVCRISNIKKSGKILLDEMNNVPSNYLDKYSDYKIIENDILIGMTGDGVFFKTGLFNHKKSDVLLNQRVGIIRLKKGIHNCSPKFISLLFNLNEVQNQIRIVAMGKTQKNVSPFDIINIRIPKITIEKQVNILKQTTPIEKDIDDLEHKSLTNLEVINSVFSTEFKVDIDRIDIINNKKMFSIPFNVLSYRNSNFRNSLRWNKIQEIQKELYKDVSCIDKLGNYIIESKNGWSPSSIEGGDGTPILGQEHINHSGTLHISPSKTTQETRKNVEDFYIKKGDFFVSRGNTVDLVALASIVVEGIEDNILFPDLYIRVRFNEERINKEYIALLFNSFFGRYYFKYVSKGKNQTMVKISAAELNDFYLPIPNKDKQTKIVNLINKKIESQKEIDKEIEAKQNEINLLIENAIKQG